MGVTAACMCGGWWRGRGMLCMDAMRMQGVMLTTQNPDELEDMWTLLLQDNSPDVRRQMAACLPEVRGGWGGGRGVTCMARACGVRVA